MNGHAKDYYKRLAGLMNSIKFTSKGKSHINFYDGIEKEFYHQIAPIYCLNGNPVVEPKLSRNKMRNNFVTGAY